LNVRRTHHAFVPFAAVAASTALSACHRSDSILLVEVAGDLALHPVELQVAVTVGLQTRSIEVPPAPGSAITLPTSFSLELDPSLTGPVQVAIEATDASGALLASGTTTQENIDVGGETIITVTLAAESATGVDAGTDSGASASDGDARDGGAGDDAHASDGASDGAVVKTAGRAGAAGDRARGRAPGVGDAPRAMGVG
jgi:hypothetical protein